MKTTGQIIALALLLTCGSCNAANSGQKQEASLEQLQARIDSVGIFDKLVLSKMYAQKKLKTLSPEEADLYLDEFKERFRLLLNEYEREEEDFINYEEALDMGRADELLSERLGNGSVSEIREAYKRKRMQLDSLGLKVCLYEERGIHPNRRFFRDLFESYLTQERLDYMDIEEVLAQELVSGDGLLQVELGELGDLIFLLEAFQEKYPRSRYIKNVEIQYHDFLPFYLKGDMSGSYYDENENLLPEVIQEFNRFKNLHPNSPTVPRIEALLKDKWHGGATTQELVDEIIAATQEAKDKLATMSPESADMFMQDFKKRMQKRVAFLNLNEADYLMHYAELHHDEDWNPVTPPADIVRKEERLKAAGLELIDLGEGEMKIDFSKSFYKNLFYNHLSQAYKDYFLLQEAEGDEPVIQDACILIDRKELGDLLVKYEDFMSQYPDFNELEDVRYTYLIYRNAYVKGLDNSPLTTSNGHLSEEVRKEFNRFVKSYPDSPTAALVLTILN